MNDWDQIRDYYRKNNARILAAGKGAWGVERYSWEYEAGVMLTPIETWLWADISALSSVLYPQYPVGRRFVDFGSPCAKVAIECDGKEFHRDTKADNLRQAEIESHGWTVYRFPGWECMTDEKDGRDEQGNWRRVQGQAFLKLREIVDRHGLREVSR